MSEDTKETKTADAVRKKIRIIAAVTALILLLGIFYVAGAYYFRTVFFPGTTINGIACGYKDDMAVAVRVLQQAQEYTLDIQGRDPVSPAEGELTSLAVLTSEEIALTVPDAETKVSEILAQQNEWSWPLALISSGGGQYNISGTSYDADKLDEILAEYEAFQTDHMTAPKDAYIGDYSSETGTYELVEDTVGSKLDMDAVYAAVDAAILAEEPQVNLETAGCYVEADVTAKNEGLLENLEEANTWLQTKITYDWNGSEVILDGTQICEWITIEDNSPVLDEEAVAEFVAENAGEYDTYGKNRTFVTTLGIELTLRGSSYGWKTDRDTETQELIALIQSGAQEDREPVYSSQGWAKGADDIGDSYVEIDLSLQHLYLYQDGKIVLESDFVSGNMSNGNMTPAGIFGLTYKTKNAVLRGEDYETPVNYWMPFNGNIGMHDATWRSSFGGSIYLTSGSHGCVNLPLSSAAAIYEYVETGFPVVCYYYPEGTVVNQTGTTETNTTETNTTETNTTENDTTENDTTENNTTENDTTENNTTENNTTETDQTVSGGDM